MNDHPRLDDNGRAALRDAAAEIVSYFLRQGPNPKLSKSGRELRWHPHGSFSLITAGPKKGCWFDHASGEGGDIIAFIRRELNCSFIDALDFAASFVSDLRGREPPPVDIRIELEAEDDEQRTEQALGIWSEAKPLRGALAETYLRSRGIEVPVEALRALRFHPLCQWQLGKIPALVMLVRDIVTCEPLGIHRIALSADGRKLWHPRLLGPSRGGAIKLGEATTELTIAEGIETALSATALGFGSAWSLISAGGIGSFPVLPGIERLTIAVDHDASGTGQRSAAACRARWEAAGRRVRTVMAREPGHDLNDVLKAMPVPLNMTLS